MPSETTFVDSNVLIYAHDLSETEKRPLAQELLEQLWEDRTGVLSTQVLQEFCAVVTKKFSPVMPMQKVREVLTDFGEWVSVTTDIPLIIEATYIEEKHKLSFWDSLIIAAAKSAGATRLLTEDLQDGQTINGVKVENPFS